MQNITRETITAMVHGRAAIYVRVSTGRQEENGTSLETQEERCLAYCTDHKYRTDCKLIYRDVWTGAEYYERPELTRLREDAKKGLFDVVIIYAFDRLARKQVHQAVIIEDLRQQGISVESVTEKFDESAVGQFMRDAAAFAAELEHEKIRERTQRGIMSKLRKGQLQGSGRTSYGYSWNEERTGYVINEEEAKTVKLIFDLYVNQGYSAIQIALYLRKQGIPNRVQHLKDGTPRLWGTTSIRGILSNPHYIGKGTTHKRIMKGTGQKAKLLGYRPEEEQFQIAEGVIPPIIDEETFIRAQEKRAVNKQLAPRNNRSPELAMLRAGYAICGVCGQNLHVHTQSAKGEKPYYVYRCYERTSTKRCNKINISVHFLDTVAWEYIETLIADKSKVEARLQEIEKKLTERTVDLGPIDSQLAEIEREMQNCARGIVKAKDEYTIEILTTENEKHAVARAELEKLRAELSEKANNLELIRLKLDHFRKKWYSKASSLKEKPTYQDKREACEILGIQATVYPVDPSKEKPRYRFKMIPPEIEPGSPWASGFNLSARYNGAIRGLHCQERSQNMREAKRA